MPDEMLPETDAGGGGGRLSTEWPSSSFESHSAGSLAAFATTRKRKSAGPAADESAGVGTSSG